MEISSQLIINNFGIKRLMYQTNVYKTHPLVGVFSNKHV